MSLSMLTISEFPALNDRHEIRTSGDFQATLESAVCLCAVRSFERSMRQVRKCKYIDMYYLTLGSAWMQFDSLFELAVPVKPRHWPTRNVPIFGCAAFYPDKQRPMPSFDKGRLDCLLGFGVAQRLRSFE